MVYRQCSFLRYCSTFVCLFAYNLSTPVRYATILGTTGPDNFIAPTSCIKLVILNYLLSKV